MLIAILCFQFLSCVDDIVGNSAIGSLCQAAWVHKANSETSLTPCFLELAHWPRRQSPYLTIWSGQEVLVSKCWEIYSNIFLHLWKPRGSVGPHPFPTVMVQTRKVFPQDYAAPSENVTDWEFVRKLFSTHLGIIGGMRKPVFYSSLLKVCHWKVLETLSMIFRTPYIFKSPSLSVQASGLPNSSLTLKNQIIL